MTRLLSRFAAVCLVCLMSAPVVHADLDHLDGTPLPDVEALTQNGATARLSDYRGRVAVVHMCAFWCGACQDLARSHATWTENLIANGVPQSAFAFIDVLFEDPFGQPSTEVHALAWKQGLGTPAEVWHTNGDPNASLNELVELIFDPATSTAALPTTFIVDGNGNVFDTVVGFSSEIVTAITAAAATLSTEIAIDIRPRSSRNRIVLSGRGTVRVALLGSDTVDVANNIDPDSISLAGAPVKSFRRFPGCRVRDVNRDSYPDLVCHIDQRAIMAEPESTELQLTASTYDGQAVSGSDTVQIIERKSRSKHESLTAATSD